MFKFQLMTPIVWLTRLLVGAYPQWMGCNPSHKQRIYFANHTSHLDTVVIWTALPGLLRRVTRRSLQRTTGITGSSVSALR